MIECASGNGDCRTILRRELRRDVVRCDEAVAVRGDERRERNNGDRGAALEIDDVEVDEIARANEIARIAADVETECRAAVDRLLILLNEELPAPHREQLILRSWSSNRATRS